MLFQWFYQLAWLAALSWTVAAEDKDGIKSIPLRTHSLTTPYLDSDMQSRWFDFGGDTVVRADSYIRLAPDRASRSGWLFSRVPLTATNWEIELTFQITGKGTLYGDGFAMWLTKQRAQPGPVFGSTDRFEGLGIFFDTYKNNRPGTVFPYVMAMLGDGQTAYDSSSDGKANELAGCSARGLRNTGFPSKARLTYFQDKNLVLELQYKNEGDWTPCFDVPNVKIPSVSYLGFSAETGELSDNFDIISVETKNLYNAAAQAGTQRNSPETNKPGRKNKGSSSSSNSTGATGSSWTWFFVKVLLFIAVCAGGYVGYTMYKGSRRGNRF